MHTRVSPYEHIFKWEEKREGGVKYILKSRHCTGDIYTHIFVSVIALVVKCHIIKYPSPMPQQ